MTEMLAAGPIYVYAVMGVETPAELPSVGIDPARPVTLLPVGDVCAVVSHVRSELFNEEAVRAGLDDRGWLAANVLAHQRVLDGLVATDLPVIPMRFCTIYADAGALAASLQRHNLAFAAELERLSGKQEWGLKMAVDIQLLQTAMGADHPTLAGVTVDADIERLRKQIAGMSPGAAFLLKKRLVNLIAERAQSISFGIADATYSSLTDVALESVTIDLPKDRPEICLNAAFWLENARYPLFMERLEALAQSFAPLGVRYELSGPWPAHHFLRLALDMAEVGA
jgi:hypothetical protein